MQGLPQDCQGMLPEELTLSDWCIVSENGEAYLIVDHTSDAFGIDGFRIQPLRHEGKNRFRNLEGRQLILLEPWPPAQQAPARKSPMEFPPFK